MPDTEFCLGPSKGYDPRIEADDPLAQRETDGGSTVTETFRRSLELVHRTLQMIRDLLSAHTEQATVIPFSLPTDQEFCCGPTEEWLHKNAVLDSSQENYAGESKEQLIIGHGEFEGVTQDSIAG